MSQNKNTNLVEQIIEMFIEMISFIVKSITQFLKNNNNNNASNLTNTEIPTKQFKEDDISVGSKDLNELLAYIKNYNPPKKHYKEIYYHTDLHDYLIKKYKKLQNEKQGSLYGRADMTIGNISIEVKGPTGADEIKTIADKIVKYFEFSKYLIIVLFDMDIQNVGKKNINESYFYDFLERTYKNFPQYKDKLFIVHKSVPNGKTKDLYSRNYQYLLEHPDSIFDSDHCGYCIFTGESIDFDVNKPYKEFKKGTIPKYCHLTGELFGTGDISLNKPIAFSNFTLATKLFGKENCIPNIKKETTVVEEKFNIDYSKIDYKQLLNTKKSDIGPLLKKCISDYALLKDKKIEDKQYHINVSISNILHIVDKEINNDLNVNFSYLDALNNKSVINPLYTKIAIELEKALSIKLI